MATPIQQLIIRVAGDIGDFARKMNGAVRIAQSAGKKIAKVGRKLTTAVTIPLTLMGATAVAQFAKFDQAMTKSISIMGDLENTTVRAMESQAIALSQTGVQSATELADSYFFLASAGLSAKDAIASLPSVQAFATAGAFDMALATDLLTDAQSALGLSVGTTAERLRNMKRVMDVFTKANTIANATSQQFAEAIGNEAGATLKVFSKDVEEGTAVLAAYADQMIKGNVAGSSLARLTRLLSKAALDNAAEHKKLGLSVFDNDGKMRKYADIIQNLEQITKGMSDETRGATLAQLGFAARVQGVLLPLLGTSEAIRQYEEKLRAAGGITNEVAEKQMKSFANQMTMLKNKMMAIAIEIGKTLAPKIEWLGTQIDNLVGWWNRLDESTQNWIVNLGLLAAAMGPAALLLGTMVTSGAALLPLFVGLVKQVTGLLVFATLNPMFAVAAGAVAALVLVVGDLVKAKMELNTALREEVKLQDKLLSMHEKQHQAKIDDINASKDKWLWEKKINAEIARTEKTIKAKRAIEGGGEKMRQKAIAAGFKPSELKARPELEAAEKRLRELQTLKAQGFQDPTIKAAEDKKKSTNIGNAMDPMERLFKNVEEGIPEFQNMLKKLFPKPADPVLPGRDLNEDRDLLQGALRPTRKRPKVKSIKSPGAGSPDGGISATVGGGKAAALRLQQHRQGAADNLAAEGIELQKRIAEAVEALADPTTSSVESVHGTRLQLWDAGGRNA